MRVLIVNYRFFVSGGPERYMFNVIEELESRGHEVVPFSVRYSANLSTKWESRFVDPIAGDDAVRFSEHDTNPRTMLRGLGRLFYSRGVYGALRDLSREVQPDVAYVLHYLRKLSPAVLKALADEGVPTVVRLSDFQMICPASHLMRDGSECEECVGGSVWPSVRYKCVKGSMALSSVDFAAMTWQRTKGFFDLPYAYACPSGFIREVMLRAGVSEKRAREIGTFVRPVPEESLRPIAARPMVIAYVGRISPEKGVEVLLEAFSNFVAQDNGREFELHIAGNKTDQYTQELRRRFESTSIKWLGWLDRPAITDLLLSARLSVMPSLSPEVYPNSLIESWACGTPVVASRIGSLEHIVTEGQTGYLFNMGDGCDLQRVLELGLSTDGRPQLMSEACLRVTRGSLSADVHLQHLVSLFEDAIQQAHTGRVGIHDSQVPQSGAAHRVSDELGVHDDTARYSI